MPPLYHRVFYYLRQKAQWKQNTFPTRKKYGIALNPGQLITSMSIIAKEVGWNEYGAKRVPNKRTIKKILEWLEFNEMIQLESNSRGTFINIINWDIYQPNKTEKVTPSAPRSAPPSNRAVHRAVHTLKEDKESSKEDSLSKEGKEHPSLFIYNFYKTEINSTRKSSIRAKKNIKYYLKKYTQEQLMKSIKNYKTVCGKDPEYRKDPANFFGKNDRCFIDYLPENFESPKKDEVSDPIRCQPPIEEVLS